MELVFQVSRSPLWLSLFIWLSDVTCRFKAAAWQLQGERESDPKIPRWEMVMFQCPTESHIFQYSKGGHPIANHLAFWAMSSTNFCSNLSLPWTDAIPPLVRWQWKIMENQWVPTIWSNFVMARHGSSLGQETRWILWFNSAVSSCSLKPRPRSLTFFVVQPHEKYMENPRFQNNVISRCDLPHWQNVNVHGE